MNKKRTAASSGGRREPEAQPLPGPAAAIKVAPEEARRWLAELEQQPATDANRAIIDYLRGKD